MGFKIGPLEIDTDFSSSSSSLASSSSDEEKKMNKKAAKGKDKKYKPDMVANYNSIIGPPSYKKKGQERPKTRFLPPPEFHETEEVSVPKDLPKNVGNLNEKEIRAALVKYVESQSCWKSTAAEEMTLSDVKLNSALIYKSEVYTEVRKVKWKSNGYEKGTPFDPVQSGVAPLPWDVAVKDAPKMFKESKTKDLIPSTGSVRKCWYCKGKGKTKCRRCKGGAYEKCGGCGGDGEINGPEGMRITCPGCSGSGQRACSRCHGHGHYKCKTCSGKKKLVWFIQMNVKWENHSEELVHEETALPDHLVTEVKSQEVFCDDQPMLKPLKEFPEEKIKQFSEKLIPQMFDKYKKEGRILRMRHSVRVTPVIEVSWKFDSEGGTFYVYGLDKKVYFPDYPQQCCCSVL